MEWSPPRPLAMSWYQTGDIEQFRLRQLLHDRAVFRVPLGELGKKKPPQVAHHEQDMLIDGVGVEQVVLHPADDMAEFRQVGRQRTP